MGNVLSEPNTDKESHCLRNERLLVGSSCMQGWRVSMEDAHTHILQLPEYDTPPPPAVAAPPQGPAARPAAATAYFAIFDGHGGSEVAQFASNSLHRLLVKQPDYRDTEGSASGAGGGGSDHIVVALRQALLLLDTYMLADPKLKESDAGSTANVLLIRHNTLYCANVGDSRAIACVDGRVEVLSHDHKPDLSAERERIVAAGGWVEDNRVNGNLALSRALGDFHFKRNRDKDARSQIVTAYADVEVRQITDQWQFVVMACDGIWDVLTNEEVVEFVLLRLAVQMSPELICEQLMTRCLAPSSYAGGLGCDNMSVILVLLLPPDGQPATLHARCRQLVESAALDLFSEESEQGGSGSAGGSDGGGGGSDGGGGGSDGRGVGGDKNGAPPIDSETSSDCESDLDAEMQRCVLSNDDNAKTVSQQQQQQQTAPHNDAENVGGAGTSGGGD